MTFATEGLTEQYGDSLRLAARARLNQAYVVAETPWFAWVAQRLGLKTNDRVLDVGCGPGWFWAAAAEFLPEGIALTLADSSPGMVGEALNRCRALPLKSVQGQVADAASLPFADSSFDAVMAMHMLYHVAEPAAAIVEMFRALKPGGVLAITTNGPGNMREIYEMAAPLGGMAQDPGAAHFGYDDAERLMRARFGNVTMMPYPAHLRITEPEDVFLALTSYPPGDKADEAQRTALRDAIRNAFQERNGVFEVRKETALFLSRKP